MSLPQRECTAGAPAAQIRVVDDVVVDQRGRVDELDDRRVEHRAVALVAGKPRGHQEHGRADALAAARLDVLARSSGSASTCDSTWRANSVSTCSRSARIGSKICDRASDDFSTMVQVGLYHGRNKRMEVAPSVCRGEIGRRPIAVQPAPCVATTWRTCPGSLRFPRMRHRRQKRAVGLDEQPVDRHGLRPCPGARPALGNVMMPASEM